MPDARVYLDVSELEPPEPMVMVMAALAALEAGQYIHMHHWREPVLLYQRLRALNCAWQTLRSSPDQWEIFVWRLDDQAAAAAAALAMRSYGQG